MDDHRKAKGEAFDCVLLELLKFKRLENICKVEDKERIDRGPGQTVMVEDSTWGLGTVSAHGGRDKVKASMVKK